MAKMKLKKRTKIGIVLNFIIVIATVFAIVWQIVFRGDAGPLGEFGSGFGSLQTFTNESNILCAIIALIMAIAGIYNLKHKKRYFARGLRTLQLIGTTAVLLTFTIVVVFLAPLFTIQTGDPLALFSSSMFFTHLLTPILAVLTFVFFTPSRAKLTVLDSLLALIPVILYGIMYLTNVVILQNWPDFYYFTFDGQNQFIPLVVAIILAGTFGLTRLLICGQKRYQNLRSK